MPKFIAYLDTITSSGSVGPDLSFKIKVGLNAIVSVGSSPKRKKVSALGDVPNRKSVSVTINGVEKDPISDSGQASGTLSLLESDEFKRQKIMLRIQGVGGDKKKSAVFTFSFYIDLIYSVSDSLFTLIEKWEGFRHTAYPDAAKNPTIGIGHKIKIPKEQPLLTATISRAEAIVLLRQDIVVAERAVNDLVVVPISQTKFDALVSLVYNIGRGNSAKSKLLSAINSNVSETIIRQEWLEWRMSGGRVLKGLELRREDELAFYFK